MNFTKKSIADTQAVSTKRYPVHRFHPHLVLLYFFACLFSKIFIYKLTINRLDLLYIVCFYTAVFFIAKYFFARLIRNRVNADLLLTVFLFPVLFFTTVADVFLRWLHLDKILSLLHLHQNTAVIVIFIIFFFIACIILSRSDVKLQRVAQFVSLYIMGLLIFKVFETAFYRSNHVSLQNNMQVSAKPVINSAPDIYYIIMDCYTGNGERKYDNSNFTNELKRKGFYVADSSRSNYNFTRSSLASSLNGSYLNVKNDAKYSTADVDTILHAIKNNQVVSFLKKLNYQFLFYTIFDIENWKGNDIENADDDTFLKIVLGPFYTPLSDRINKRKEPGIKKSFYDYNSRSFYLLDSLSNTENHNNHFFLIHSLATHAPFVMDPDGKFTGSITYEARKQAYLQEVQYANKRLLAFVDKILSAKGPKPVIIIQGDHGSHLNDLDETSTILNCYYFPGQDYHLLYPSISPVNTFRVVFNQFFNAGVPELADSSYHVFYGSLY